MGKRGPLKPPTDIRIARGDREADIEVEIEPEARRCPTPPDWMSTGAKRVWRRLAGDLHEQGVLTWWDRDAFAAYCTAVDLHRQATIAVNSAQEDGGGILVVGQHVGAVKHPALQIQRDAGAVVLQYAARFGLTPSDRLRLSPKKGKPTGDDAVRHLLS